MKQAQSVSQMDKQVHVRAPLRVQVPLRLGIVLALLIYR